MRQLFTCVDALPIDRDNMRQSMGVLKEVRRRVEAGKVCLIFPVALVNSYKPFDTDIKGHITVYLHILKPLFREEYAGMNTAEVARTVKRRIRNEIDLITGGYQK